MRGVRWAVLTAGSKGSTRKGLAIGLITMPATRSSKVPFTTLMNDYVRTDLKFESDPPLRDLEWPCLALGLWRLQEPLSQCGGNPS